MIIKAYHLEKGEPIRTDIEVTSKNYWIVRRRLELERIKILNILRLMEEQGVIKGIRQPRNKKIQPYLNKLIEAKHEIIKTVDKLKILFT